MPDCFEYEGKLLETSKVIEWFCKHYEGKVAQSGDVK